MDATLSGEPTSQGSRLILVSLSRAATPAGFRNVPTTVQPASAYSRESSQPMSLLADRIKTVCRRMRELKGPDERRIGRVERPFRVVVGGEGLGAASQHRGRRRRQML